MLIPHTNFNQVLTTKVLLTKESFNVYIVNNLKKNFMCIYKFYVSIKNVT